MRAIEDWCMGQTQQLLSRVAQLKQSQETNEKRIDTLTASIGAGSQRVLELEKMLAELRIKK